MKADWSTVVLFPSSISAFQPSENTHNFSHHTQRKWSQISFFVSSSSFVPFPKSWLLPQSVPALRHTCMPSAPLQWRLISHVTLLGMKFKDESSLSTGLILTTRAHIPWTAQPKNKSMFLALLETKCLQTRWPWSSRTTRRRAVVQCEPVQSLK
jgi:hypothetical protein